MFMSEAEDDFVCRTPQDHTTPLPRYYHISILVLSFLALKLILDRSMPLSSVPTLAA